jgi:hypothetical protein
VSESHPLNAFAPAYRFSLENLTEVKALQPSNALEPMVVWLPPLNTIDDNESQPLKQSPPIVAKELPKLTPSSASQFSNALFEM